MKPWKTKFKAPADTRYRAGKTQRRAAFEADLEVTIDWDKLARVLGARATGNSTGKSRLLGGIITAKTVTKAPGWEDA